MDSTASQPKRKNTEFRRACRFLYPYRAMVIVSIVAALFVGAIFTSGLGAMLPILQVLINRDTVQNWIDRRIANQRLGVVLADSAGVIGPNGKPAGEPLIVHVHEKV